MKIYFNNNSLILTDRKDQCQGNVVTCPDAQDVRVAIEACFGNQAVKITLFSQDYDKLKDLFLSFFSQIQAAGGIVRNTITENILFIHRGDRWDLPKGWVEENEPFDLAAIREVQEECGLKHLTLHHLIYTTHHAYILKGKWMIKSTHWYYMTTRQSHTTPQIEEGIDQAKWFAENECHTPLSNTYRNIKNLFKIFLEQQQNSTEICEQTQNSTIKTLVALGKEFSSPSPELKEAILKARQQNPWFTAQNIQQSLLAFSEMLSLEKLQEFAKRYPHPSESKKIALILAGNIPLVGLHDILCTLLSGHKAIIKPSSDDRALLEYVVNFIKSHNHSLGEMITISEQLPKDFDAVIATGSANTSRYFEYYFAHKPSIIRSSRSSIAVITADISDGELDLLSDDIMMYFGLGCRNVSLLFIPEDFDIRRIISALSKYEAHSQHHKYKSNYDYYRTIYAMSGQTDIIDTGFAILHQGLSLKNPVSVISYFRYDDIAQVGKFLSENSQDIQCVVAREGIPFGEAQEPSLMDFADSVDTMEFLSRL